MRNHKIESHKTGFVFHYRHDLKAFSVSHMIPLFIHRYSAFKIIIFEMRRIYMGYSLMFKGVTPLKSAGLRLNY